MIKKLIVENFKSIKQLNLELAPLTIFVGPNGSGKSSILEAVALMSQSFGRSCFFDGRKGSLVEIEDVEALFVKGDTRQWLSLGFEMELKKEEILEIYTGLSEDLEHPQIKAEPKRRSFVKQIKVVLTRQKNNDVVKRARLRYLYRVRLKPCEESLHFYDINGVKIVRYVKIPYYKGANRLPFNLLKTFNPRSLKGVTEYAWSTRALIHKLMDEFDVIIINESPLVHLFFLKVNGKGKIVAYLAKKDKPDIVVRGGVGPNAGHTVEFNDKKIGVRMVPSGFVYEKARLLIGAGVLVDPKVFLNEVKTLKVEDRTGLDYRCAIIENKHIEMDRKNSHLKVLRWTSSLR